VTKAQNPEHLLAIAGSQSRLVKEYSMGKPDPRNDEIDSNRLGSGDRDKRGGQE